jgi:hypothetical protein
LSAKQIQKHKNVRRERGKVRVCRLCNETVKHFNDALLNGDVDTCRRLHASGLVAVSNVHDEHGESPIHIVARSGSLKTLNWILSQGADVHALSLSGDTALQYAATNRHWEMTRFLIVKMHVSVKTIRDIDALRDLFMQALRVPSKEADECVVCLDSRIDTAVIPCGHVCVCFECSGQIMDCPMCRCKKEGRIQLYFTNRTHKTPRPNNRT